MQTVIRRICFVVAALGLLQGQAQAAFFFSRPAFDAANPGLPTLDFEGFAPAGGFIKPAPSFAGSGVTFDAFPGSSNDVAIADSAFFFNTPTDALFVDLFGSALVMNFAPVVGAAGFDVANGFDGGLVQVDVFNGIILLDTTTFFANDQTLLDTFIGVSGLGPITQIVVTPLNGGFINIDNLSFGNAEAVPEPASILMLALGSVSLGGYAMRRRKCLKTK